MEGPASREPALSLAEGSYREEPARKLHPAKNLKRN